jgi:sugar phosphate isomerase/epimerase
MIYHRWHAIGGNMMTVSRRDLLLAGMFLALQAHGAPAAKSFFRGKQIPIGLQLYTVGDDMKRDFAGTLSAISAIGYRSVEPAGLLDHTPAEWRKTLDRLQLKCPSIHVSPKAQKTGLSLADIDALAEAAHTLGIGTIVCPSFNLPDSFSLQPQPGESMATMLARLGASMSADDWKTNADFLNQKGAALKKLGLQFAYHNHNIEFTPVGETTGFALLVNGTDPNVVSFEMDAGWVAAAGIDPAALLSRYPHRFTAMHVKDIKAGTKPNFALQLDPCEVGTGTIDWKTLLPKAYAANVHQFYVEQEPPYSKPPLESIAVSFKYLDGLAA